MILVIIKTILDQVNNFLLDLPVNYEGRGYLVCYSGAIGGIHV